MAERRALVVVDSDSYIKWGAALASAMPKAWDVKLLVVRSNAEPSARQLRAALEGSGFAPESAPVVGERGFAAVMRSWAPDVLVAAARGPTVQAMLTLVPNGPRRPVVVSGLAGISVPVLPLGLGFRRAVDIFCVQSRRELRDFRAAAATLGIDHRFELATLPLVEQPPGRESAERIVFAAQSLVPAELADRMWVVERLADLARRHGDLTVVLKVRSLAGEAETHSDQHPYPQLLAQLPDAPDNLVIEAGPMREHLARAAGLVSVSSTALLEAVAAGVPVVALTDFGVGDELINTVFEGSGLWGTFDDVERLDFRLPDPAWADDNYFHDPAENTWISAVEELLLERDVNGLPPVRGRAGLVRQLIYRRTVFVDGRGETRVQKALLKAGRMIVGRPSAARELARRVGR